MTKARFRITADWLSCLVIFAILAIDQIIKIFVKTNMAIGDDIKINDWFYICFIENKGMAYGMTFINKSMLSIIRLIAIIVIGIYIHRQVKNKARIGYILCLSMVLAGAAGNIIDSMFYGMCFTESTMYSVSTYVGWGNGYAPFLMGKVVDMFYFPIIRTTYPLWMPFKAGEPFIFFSPIFNFADACISVGVVLLLIFYRKEISSISFSFSHRNDKDKESK